VFFFFKSILFLIFFVCFSLVVLLVFHG